MEKLYVIKDNYAEITLKKDIYPLVSIEKALSNIMEDFYIKIDSDNENIIIKIFSREKVDNLEKIIGEFYNELLRESLRYNIAMETKDLRNLIVGRALYATCIQNQEDDEKNINFNSLEKNMNEENYKIEDIAVNWFEKYKKEE